jgi:GT2 family glycosyltransferase
VPPPIDVVIPARNAAAVLGECLSALAASRHTVDLRQVIVVDDGSTDDTAALARARGAAVIRLPGLGPAAARNAGARAATSEIIVFLDADCVPEPDCLAALVAPFADARVAGVRGSYTSRQRALVARFVQLELEEKQAQMAASREVSVVDTACAAYRRATFWAYQGFDERFPATSAEDVDLSFRMAANHERLVYAPEARVRHQHPADLRRYLWRKLRFGYFRAQLYGRFPGRVQQDGYTPRVMPLQIGLAGLLSAALVASLWLAPAGPVAAAAAIAFVALSAPMTRRALATDPPLALFVPALLYGRSLAQGLGLGWGIAAMALSGAGARGAGLLTAVAPWLAPRKP